MNNSNSDNRTIRLVFTALMICLVLLGTVMFRLPIPMTQGYVHLGDAMIFLGVMLLGKKNGSVAAGIGSALADVLGGFAFWAPWTFIIKFAMAYLSGLVIEKARTEDSRDHNAPFALQILAMAAGGVLMCAGYFFAESVMYSSAAIAALGIPWNAGQAVIGIVISIALHTALSKLPVPAGIRG